VFSNLPFGERLGENRLQLEGFYRTFGERMRTIDGGRVVLFSSLPEARWLLNLDEVAVGKPRFWKFSAGDIDAWLMRWDLPYSGYQPSERTPKKPRKPGAAPADDVSGA
jgi:23S rRNA G2445 N2-methylase RlmL